MAAPLLSALPDNASGWPRKSEAARLLPARVDGVAPDRKANSERTALGIVCLLASTVLFPVSDTVAKHLTATYSGFEVAWARYLVLVIAVLPPMLRRPGLVRTAQPALQVARGLSSALATTLALVGFAFLPVADATAIGFCAPLIVIALAALLLREPVGVQRWAAAAVGFVGIVVIVQPGGGAFQAASLLPLASSFFSAATVIGTRLTRGDKAQTTLFVTALVGFVILTALMPFVWVAPDRDAVLLALVMGIVAAAASVLQLLAYRLASASLLAAFSYSQIVWAMGIGWLVFGTVPSTAMLAGSAIVVVSGAAAGLSGPSRPRRRRIEWTLLRRDLGRLDPASRRAA